MPENKTEKSLKNKVDLGAKGASYPMPVTLVGATVKGKPNFLAAAWFTFAGLNPPKVAVALNKAHYTNQGIKDNKTFSLCIPSEDMVKATDYCGIISGFKADKSSVFDVFYGKLKTAPMITECPSALNAASTKLSITAHMNCSLEKSYPLSQSKNT